MRKQHNELKDLRQFGTVLAGIFLIFGTIHFFKGHVGWYSCFLGLGVITVILVLVLPKSIKPVYIIFNRIAHAIGWFNTRAILILIYFVLVTPIALVMKISGKDPLNKKIDKNELSYWTKHSTVRPTKEQLEKQF